jgi:hypothetical protein
MWIKEFLKWVTDSEFLAWVNESLKKRRDEFAIQDMIRKIIGLETEAQMEATKLGYVGHIECDIKPDPGDDRGIFYAAYYRLKDQRERQAKENPTKDPQRWL